MEPTVKFCTQRVAEDEHGVEEIHLECRFSDGQKLAAVIVSSDFPELANRIELFLNNGPAGVRLRPHHWRVMRGFLADKEINGEQKRAFIVMPR